MGSRDGDGCGNALTGGDGVDCNGADCDEGTADLLARSKGEVSAVGSLASDGGGGGGWKSCLLLSSNSSLSLLLSLVCLFLLARCCSCWRDGAGEQG